MALLFFVGIIVFGMLALAGTLWLLAVIFSEGILWGLASLFIPGASLLFVVTHWDNSKRPFALHGFGLVGLFAVIFLTAPGLNAAIKEGADDGKSRAASAQPVATCPATAPPPDGFSKWCCTSSGWKMISEADDCSSSGRPTSSCDSTLAGTVTTEGCSTLGPSKRTKQR